MKDTKIDKELKIRTTGRDDSGADELHHPYEPTPYEVLDCLLEEDYISKDNIIVDYGCGKGRVSFYLAAKTGCKAIGIEYDERIYEQAVCNKKTYSGRGTVEFLCISAEAYIVTEADCFYFFNPFTIEILQSVIGKILESYYENPRSMQLFFYYPDDEYLSYLMTKEELMFVDEIDCSDLFSGRNVRERVMIFEVYGALN